MQAVILSAHSAAHGHLDRLLRSQAPPTARRSLGRGEARTLLVLLVHLRQYTQLVLHTARQVTL
jgi:hypothetical protein